MRYLKSFEALRSTSFDADSIEMAIKNLIKKNLPEEIYHIRDLATDIKDEFNFETKILICLTYEYDTDKSNSIVLTKNLDPDLSGYKPIDGPPCNWPQLYDRVKTHIESSEVMTFRIFFISNELQDIKVIDKLKEKIAIYNRTQKSIQVIPERGWLIVKIEKK